MKAKLILSALFIFSMISSGFTQQLSTTIKLVQENKLNPTFTVPNSSAETLSASAFIEQLQGQQAAINRDQLDSSFLEVLAGIDLWLPLQQDRFDYTYGSSSVVENRERMIFRYLLDDQDNILPNGTLLEERQLRTENNERGDVTLREVTSYTTEDTASPEIPFKDEFQYVYEGDRISQIVVRESEEVDGNFVLQQVQRRFYNENQMLQRRVVDVYVDGVGLSTELWSYNYNPDGQLEFTLAELTQLGGGPDTVNFLRFTYGYDEQGRQSEQIAEVWVEDSRWMPFQRFRSFEQEGVSIQELSLWDTTQNNWALDQLLGYDTIDVSDNEELISIYELIPGTSNLANTLRIKNYYSAPNTVSTDHIFEASALTVYPNPTTEQIHIDDPVNQFSQIRVYDINGRLVLSQSLDGSTVDVSAMTGGIYIYHLFDDTGKIYANKFVIQK